jgi:thymidine kinase
MGELHITMGPMFSSKSTSLITKATNLLNDNIGRNEILMINHIFDNRYSKESNISTHDGKHMSSKSLQTLNNIFNIDSEDYIDMTDIKYIFIDEAQFFKGLFQVVKKLLFEHNKIIYLAGLDGDYKQDQFKESDLLTLIPYASSVQKLNANCTVCNKPAPFTKRLIASESQIVIGGSSDYQPVCINHL